MKQLKKIAKQYIKKFAQERTEGFLMSPMLKHKMLYWTENRPPLTSDNTALLDNYKASLMDKISGVRANKRLEIIYPLYKEKADVVKKIDQTELVKNPDFDLLAWQLIILKNLMEDLLTEEKLALEIRDSETSQTHKMHGLI